MSNDTLFLGTGGSRFSGQRGRTADGVGRSGVLYPSPFFDIGHTYLPPSMKALLRWCRYYYLVNPLINSVIHKMSEYPITELVIDEKNPKVKEKWETLLGETLRYRAFQIEVGLDYYTYGMCLVTIHFPFTKWLQCNHCKHKVKAAKAQYSWRNLDYVLHCEKCGQSGSAKVQDAYERDVKRIRLMRWNPEYVNVDPAFAGAEPVYTFDVPLQVRNDIILGKKTVLDTIPDVFIEALRRNKFIRFSDDNVFVFKRPIISQKDMGWGMPLIMPVLKDVFYLQILRKAQEAIAQEHIIPLRVLFPQAGSGTSDPYTTIPLDNWKGRIEAEIAKWKYDPNYIPVLPLPIGNQSIGGDGKALGLYQEMEVWSRHVVAGMGVPEEFIFGGMQYSGSNVSMRMVEQQFTGYRLDHHQMLNNFVIKRIADFMGWPPVRAHMRRFKMADDLQRLGLFFQLNQAMKISDRTLLEEADFDPEVEHDRKKGELDRSLELQRKMQLAQANIAGEVQVVQARYQAQAQQLMVAAMPGAGAPGMEGAPPGGAPGMDPMQGGQQTGQEGEMLPGEVVDPGMPAGSTVSMQNAQQAPQEGVPQEMQSPLGSGPMGQMGGGVNILYLAKRAAEAVQKMPEAEKFQALEKMKLSNPQLYMVVLRLLQSEQGSQENPLDPMQSPMPEQKPTRRAAPVGV